MKLQNCLYGTLVQSECGKVGMVKGIANNCDSGDLATRSEPEREIPLIQWQSGETVGCHHGNLTPLN